MIIPGVIVVAGLYNPTNIVLKKILEGKKFKCIVDLGCGEGGKGWILKKHCKHLIGVDRNKTRLKKASKTGYYDELHLSDIMEYQIPGECDLVTMIDVIEHLPKNDGYILLNNIGNKSSIIITPAKYFPIARDGHISLWTEWDFTRLGYTVYRYRRGWIMEAVYGYGIAAVKFI